jgi:hypothetical protein
MKVRNKSTGREIAEELLTSGYFERARRRASRRQSPWNILLVLMSLASIAGAWMGIVWIADHYLPFSKSGSRFSSDTLHSQFPQFPI